MANVLIRLTEPDDIETLHANLRASDRAECEAYGTVDALEGIRASVASSLLCWTGTIDGHLAAIMGVAPVSVVSGVGSPWMLGTPVLDANGRILVAQVPIYIAQMLEAFPHLVNHVHAENVKSVRWLRKLGFEIHPAAPFGALGAMFHKFEMRA